MSGRSIKFHHKTKVENCVGIILDKNNKRIDKKDVSQKWVYWCPNINKWLLESCNH